MSKPFNIHDWQAKQRQLSEIRAQDVPGTAAFMGKNMRSRGMSNSENMTDINTEAYDVGCQKEEKKACFIYTLLLAAVCID